ncbi:MAG: response regulator [Candidatus Eisenbacteria bacterium]|jgi:FixJ family two-component response regulator|nr:response regulator [Candidatus Eisenbacteria bacterium]
MTDELDALEEAPNHSRHAILIVDDEVTFRRSLSEGISLLSGDKYQPVGVGSVDQALALLKHRPFAALVTDIRMPGKDGLQLLLEMKRQSIRVPTLVTTAYGSPAVHAQAARSGAVRYMEKPFPLEHLIDFLDAATAEVQTARARSLDLVEVVEMLCMGGRDMRVAVRTRDIQGSLYIKTGEIVHATMGERTGSEALLDLLALPQTQISTDPGEEAPEITIDVPWRELTEEAWRRRTLMAPRHAGAAPPTAPEPAPVEAPETTISTEAEQMLARPVEPALPAPEPLSPPAPRFWAGVGIADIEARLAAALGSPRPPTVLELDAADQASALLATGTGERVGVALGAGGLVGCVVKVAGAARVYVPAASLHAVRGDCFGPALPERRLYACARAALSASKERTGRWAALRSRGGHRNGGGHGTR